ncbi:hypothetical protein EUGRSUZ_G00884 [Eucalyptus grandis]|uniref:Uncharacterized protein n=2 Tax=Eucalyptus grandis TaxID=71139 RepID=A0A059BC52_EUCGR|nr:hypothetical protein EUGRSUZ_G00884 [Eucalyptus grandis]
MFAAYYAPSAYDMHGWLKRVILLLFVFEPPLSLHPKVVRHCERACVFSRSYSPRAKGPRASSAYCHRRHAHRARSSPLRTRRKSCLYVFLSRTRPTDKLDASTESWSRLLEVDSSVM